MILPKKGLSALFIIFMTLSVFSIGSQGSITPLHILLDCLALPLLAFNFFESTPDNTGGMILLSLALMVPISFFSKRFLLNLESK